MITSEEIEAGLKLLGPHKKFPYYFVDYPEVNVLLDLLPKALEEVRRLRSVNKPSGYDSPYAGAVKDEMEKLRAVAEAANWLVNGEHKFNRQCETSTTGIYATSSMSLKRSGLLLLRPKNIGRM